MKNSYKQISEVKFNKSKVTPQIILTVISKNCGVSVEDILSKVRKKEVVDARHYFFTIMRKHLGHTTTSVGRFTDRDHTTVIHGIRTFNDRYSSEENYKNVYDSILHEIWTKI